MSSEKVQELVEVRFKGRRKEFFKLDSSIELNVGDPVVVDVERGQDLGRVSAVGAAADKKCGVACANCGPNEKPEARGLVVRVATEQESNAIAQLRKAEDDVRRKVRERTAKHGLDMKISDAEWQWDRKKLTIFFTAENRVDFRQLVRDLASLFRSRIELRQIGARDEAKRLSGVGRCGREYCCSSWLPELRPVSLGLAKDQHLSLNPSQISGGCGRLLCCLRYEHGFYVAARKRFPKEGKTVTTTLGEERVQAVDIFRERVLLRSQDGASRTLTLLELKTEVSDHRQAAGPRTLEVKVPAALGTFDEGPTSVTEVEAAEAVAPQRKKRRGRRRQRRRRRGNDKTSDGNKKEDSSGK